VRVSRRRSLAVSKLRIDLLSQASRHGDHELVAVAVLAAAVLLLALRPQALTARDAAPRTRTAGTSTWVGIAEQIDATADACADGPWPPPGHPPEEPYPGLGPRDATALLQVITAATSRLAR